MSLGGRQGVLFVFVVQSVPFIELGIFQDKLSIHFIIPSNLNEFLLHYSSVTLYVYCIIRHDLTIFSCLHGEKSKRFLILCLTLREKATIISTTRNFDLNMALV